MSDDETYIYRVQDLAGDTLGVQAYRASIGPVVIFHNESSSSSPWLTPKDSKRLRKALKVWERSVA